MLKRTLLTLAAGLSLAAAASAETQVYYGFQIGITNAPPPPRVIYREQPAVMVVPGTTVYVVDPEDNDCDMFRYGSYWYATSGGYWYRAKKYSGPFIVIDARRVPRAIYNVPARHWRHHPHGGPPGLTKKHGHKHSHGRHGHGKKHSAHNDD